MFFSSMNSKSLPVQAGLMASSAGGGVGRIVVQFANDQVGDRGRRIDDELGLVERRPHAAAECADS